MTIQDWYLDSQDLRVPLGEVKDDFYSAMLSLFGARLDVPSPEIMILTRRNDAEADQLSIALGRRGHAVARCNVEDLESRSTLTVSIGDHAGPAPLRFSHVDRPDATPRLLYFRHFDLDALTQATAVGPRGAEVHRIHATFHRQQWTAMIDALMHCGPRVVGANAVRANDDRVRQVHTARRLGWAIPPTLVSNCTDDLRDFALASPEGIIVKALGSHFVEKPPQVLNGFFPRVLRPQDAIAEVFDAGGSRREPSPVLCQWFVPSRGEIRAYVVGSEVSAFRIEKTRHDDLWDDPGGTGIAQMEIDDDTSRALVRLSRSLAMDVCAIDLLLTDEGLVFLEANANGDWCWVESGTHTADLTEMHAAYLERMLHEISPE